ncbi:ankyrin repeat domain-containing protein 7-like [Apodemus sylvaticus]|uniref:ankyrin repeat domain-containing protein 7-like n=1 Tax=Apodemus sylvaticus TaxID=10129 RepID=UPI00224489E8|nr:ankyrin repeat domain-containing protein 7-like [Apodemus sylvaticus]
MEGQAGISQIQHLKVGGYSNAFQVSKSVRLRGFKAVYDYGGFLSSQHHEQTLTELWKLDSVNRTLRCVTPDKYDLLLYDPDNAFHSAVCLGKANKVQSLLEQEKCNVNDRDGNNRTALHFASCYGMAEIVNILMENDCEINALDNQKTTPLIKAVQMCEENIVYLLLEHGADPNIKDADGNTALHYAVYVGKPAIAAALLPYGANIEEKTEDGFSPLLLALRENQLLMAEFLIRRGADIHVSDDQQRTTLMYAVKSDSKRIVDLLLKLDIDVFLKDSFSWNALRYAIMGHRKVARTILEHQDSIIRHIQRSNRDLVLIVEDVIEKLYKSQRQ